MIREASAGDLDRITDIYNQAILSRRATADLEPFTAEQRRPWFREHVGGRTPVYVCEHDGVVAGYCYLSAYRGRKALDGVAEISYYVDFAHHRKGIGGRLVRHVIGEAHRLGYRTLIAVLLSCNDASRALLENCGFALWGTLPDVVRIDENTVYSHHYMGLHLH